jgi:hypothetical protein
MKYRGICVLSQKGVEICKKMLQGISQQTAINQSSS